MTQSQVARVEAIIGRTVRRDISRMVNFAKGGLEKAAKSILETPNAHVGIVTGFFIRHAEPPSPETDGLGGAAHMAASLAGAGIPVTVISDAPCAKAVWAVVDAIPERIDLEIVSVDDGAVRKLRQRLQDDSRPLTHLIAIERVSPGSDGKPHREHGWDISNDTAPLHLLFDEPGWDRPWVTIGIGDGGNEIGMGVLPEDIVKNDVPNGKLIAGTTPADVLIVAGVSNWGGYGLVAAMEILSNQKNRSFTKYFNREMDHNFLKAAVEVGQAVDDSRPDKLGRPQMSVDRLPWEEHADLLDELRAVVTN